MHEDGQDHAFGQSALTPIATTKESSWYIKALYCSRNRSRFILGSLILSDVAAQGSSGSLIRYLAD